MSQELSHLTNNGNNEHLAETCHDIIQALKEQSSYLQRTEEERREESESKIRNNEWRLLAKVMDRLFMILYMFLTILLSVVFFANIVIKDQTKPPPSIDKN